ncbi:zinc finger BED domain-containing protein RICESLEEPER 2 [Artemisia annua]|uniref:Zinc finger BED domain-containing protein RICESLEEPER 2 n=1 Tax=Artemisia annua TaxID=35608 RepID=A0A2U1PDI5_ARTAN|nr:zinc finger BED domain-containing protein RICESLEEPER 2 [Artemisia annua]
MERPDGPDGELTNMAYCKFFSQVYRADPVRNGTKNMNLHYPICKGNPMNEERLKQQKLCFTKKENNGDAELPFKFVEHPAFIKYSKSFQPKCMAHILNLVVKDGLKVHEKAVETIGSAVKYIKNSSQRIEKFKVSIKNTCDSNRFLIAECPTRWNSTYDMLKSAIDLQEAFYNYNLKNASFSRDLESIAHRANFDACQRVCDF